jgi:hypothetical protein
MRSRIPAGAGIAVVMGCSQAEAAGPAAPAPDAGIE